jgi:hypothetical protein
MADAVRVEGLADLRRDLKRLAPDVLPEIRGALKDAADLVASKARANAPRASGALAASIRSGTAGNAGVVRSRLPYAKVHEYGGTIRPRGAPITIHRAQFVGRALTSTEDRIVESLADSINAVASRHGWH